MKVFILCCLLAVAFAQECAIRCDPNAPKCPENANCAKVETTNTVTYVCACNTGFSRNCTCTNLNGCQMSCLSRPTPVCKPECPLEASCVFIRSDSTEGTCFCKDTTKKYDVTSGQCVPSCPPNAHLDRTTLKCECDAGYEKIYDTNNVYFKCQLVTTPEKNRTLDCTTLKCPEGYTCVPPTNTGESAYCKPNQVQRRCGFEFKCPDDIHFKCLDTVEGPKCVCAEGWGGLSCNLRRCDQVKNNDGTVTSGCFVGNAVAVYRDSICYCECATNYYGPYCNRTVQNNCPEDCLKIANAYCLEGKCACKEGYARDPATTDPARICAPIPREGPCTTMKCESNKVCVEKEGKGYCICPADLYGGFLCDRPACRSDDECVKILANSYCAENVKDQVQRFCQCKIGFTGERCEQPAPTCDPMKCDGKCTNEGRCIPPDPQPEICLEITVTLRKGVEISARELIVRVANALKIDISLIKVEGPKRLSDGRTRWFVSICGDDNWDATLAAAAAVNSGGNFIEDADSVESGRNEDGDDTSADSNSASMVAASLITVVAAVAML